MRNKVSATMMAKAYIEGVEDMWKIISKGDREHPEWNVPFSVFKEYASLKGLYEDKIEELSRRDNE